MKNFKFVLVLLLLSCNKESNQVSTIQFSSALYTNKNWYELCQRITDKVQFAKYLKMMFDDKNVKIDHTENSIRNIGDPNNDINLLAAIAISQKFLYNDILWNELDEDLSINLNKLDSRTKTYKKWDGVSKAQFSLSCLGVKYKGFIWTDKFNGGCNPPYYVKKIQSYICCGDFNCSPFPYCGY